MEKFEILTDAELATVVAGFDPHGFLRQKTGMCGCGITPPPGSVHLH